MCHAEEENKVAGRERGDPKDRERERELRGKVHEQQKKKQANKMNAQSTDGPNSKENE